MYIHIIVARYNENLEWLYNILTNHTNITAIIYNDGEQIDLPVKMKERIVIKEGDRVPCEPTKYMRYILDNWDNYDNTITHLVFCQGDPIYHNPTFVELFHDVNRWNISYQNLTLYPHPPSTGWGCSREIENGTAPNITYFSNKARTWCDTDMDDHFKASFYADQDWLNQFYIENNITVSRMCNKIGILKPSGSIPKTYAAMFSTSWDRIRKHPRKVWENVHDLVKTGDIDLIHFSQKVRACFIEYMWAVLLYEV